MTLIFQYGSNMSSERLNSADRLNGDARSQGLAITSGNYDLDFTVWSKTNNCAAADIISGGRQLYGVLYEIPDDLLKRETAGDRKSLDSIEGKGINYKRQTIQVSLLTDPDTPINAWTYTVINKTNEFKTELPYVHHILQGLREHNAPLEYIEYVISRIIRNNPDLQSQNT